MKLSFWQHLSLNAKLAVSICMMVFIMDLAITFINVYHEKSHFRAELLQQAEFQLTTLEAVVFDPLLQLDTDQLEEFAEVLGNTELLTTVRIYDESGRIVADSQSSQVLVSSTEPVTVGQMLTRQTGTFIEWQDDYLRAGKPVMVDRQAVGAIEIILSTEASSEQQSRLRNDTFLISLMGTMVSLMLAFVISRTITDPLYQLERVVARFGEGETAVRAPLGSHQEINHLATTFNTMADTILRGKQQLIEVNQERESRIRDRTADLVDINIRLQHEITERKQAQSELIVARDQALESLKLKNQIQANVSHDARTPLNVILLRTELLQRYGVSDFNQLDEYLSSIMSSTRQLLEFFENLLQEALLSGSSGKLQIVKYSIRSVVNEVIAVSQPLADTKGIELRVAIANNFPPTTEGDPQRVKQILNNLVGNAIKFTHQGYVALNVYLESPNQWIIEVHDTGRGIAENQLDMIFGAFWQVDGSITRDVNSGVGLGLSIVKQLTTLLGGSVSVESEVGNGSTFKIILPIQDSVRESTYQL